MICTDSQAALETRHEGLSRQPSLLGMTMYEALTALARQNPTQVYLQWAHTAMYPEAKQATQLPQADVVNTRLVHRAAAGAVRLESSGTGRTAG